MKYIDILGQTFGNWTVLEKLKSVGPKWQTKWLCRCKCGKTQPILSNALRTGKSTKCRDCVYTHARQSINNRYWWHMIGGARFRNIEFSISREYAYNLLVQQGFRCKLSGMPIEISKECRIQEKEGATASLDRIDSSKGYVEGNVQWLHKDVNLMKNHFDQDYFLATCRLVSQQPRMTHEAA